DDDQPFEEYGVDSLVSITILTRLEADLGSLSKTLLFEQNTIRRLAAFLCAEFAPQLGRLAPAAAAPRVGAPAALFPIRETGPGPRSFWVHSVVGEMNWAVRLA